MGFLQGNANLRRTSSSNGPDRYRGWSNPSQWKPVLFPLRKISVQHVHPYNRQSIIWSRVIIVSFVASAFVGLTLAHLTDPHRSERTFFGTHRSLLRKDD